jgi:serine/threonine protein phosphatase PrpC
MIITAAGASVTGKRERNEDAFCIDAALGLYVVADGLGGYEGGEVASRLAVDTVREFLLRNAEDPDATWPFKASSVLTFDENLMQVAVRWAHQSIVEQRAGVLAQMGSTLSALLVRNGRAVIAHVGDSKILRLRQGRLSQLTREHSLYAELAAARTQNLPPRSECPFGHVITRALGMGGDAMPDLTANEIRSGDVFLLCSDGLDPVPVPRVAELLALPPAQSCDALIAEALERGSRDNVTAVVVRSAA